VTSTSFDSACFCPEKRGGRRRTYLVLIGTIVTLGVGANATPALASDGVEPVPEPELTVSQAIPPAPELEVDETGVVPDLDEPPIVIDANVDGGDLDVSVRVLSPGADEAEEAVEAASGVISEALETDITVDPVLPDAPPAAADQIDADTLDTNVTIRVLSPGRNGSVNQQSGLADDDAARPSPDEAPTREDEPAGAVDDRPELAEDLSQYHDDNTQYQSEVIPDLDPWVWDWYLALDCSGNVTSTSYEIGSPDSRDWDWNWNWDWTCGFDGASEESGDALQEGFASIASVSSSAGATGAGSGTSTTTGQQSGQQSGEQSETSGAPWLWIWTFNFCGRETTFSIEAGEDTFLEWAWDWTWAWACTGAEADAPATGGEGPSGPAAETSTPTGELELPPPLEIVTALPLLSGALFAAPPMTEPFVFEAPVAIAPVIPLGRTLPTGPGPEQAPASGPGRPPVSAAPVAVEQAPTAIDVATALPSAPRSDRARPTKGRDREASPRPARHLPQLPLGPARRAAGSATSSSGSAPGGGGATSVAALTGFYVLAAPGLGRRLRVVRELSPHTRAEAPRDRPG
jgi:hypothetical protein